MELLKIKNATGIINAKDGLSSLLVTGEEKIGKLNDRSLEICNCRDKKECGNTKINMREI